MRKIHYGKIISIFILGGIIVAFAILILFYRQQLIAIVLEHISSQKGNLGLLNNILKDDNYEDFCLGNIDCELCKRDLNCLQCMDDCYNRYGNYLDNTNHYKIKSLTCNKQCWNDNFNQIPDIDFGIKTNK